MPLYKYTYCSCAEIASGDFTHMPDAIQTTEVRAAVEHFHSIYHPITYLQYSFPIQLLYS